MALTAQQVVDCRRFMGYSVSGDTTSQPYRELSYSSQTFMSQLSLDYRLAHLTAEEETRLINFYLANLTLRETEIQGAAGNLDTDKAAVWTRNRTEVSDRINLFTALRIELCNFLGFKPGPTLAQGNRLVRA
jgi:hypothetical protein